MRTTALGQTGMMVSGICLGTMTWGTQNTEADGHAQADMALDHGVTFWDTAEMYPVNPVLAEVVLQVAAPVIGAVPSSTPIAQTSVRGVPSSARACSGAI